LKVVGWSKAEGPLAFGIRAGGPESNQPWASPKVWDAKRNQALKARQPHNLETIRCGWC
jgi:hypothetical protein